jgi:hypothetical protein
VGPNKPTYMMCIAVYVVKYTHEAMASIVLLLCACVAQMKCRGCAAPICPGAC